MKVEVFVMAIMVMCICPGRVSGEKDLLQKDERHLRYCRYPRGKPGAVRSHGCIQSICTHGKWTTKMRTDICCYKQKEYKLNSILEEIISADNCSSTTLSCGAAAQIEIQQNSNSCAHPATQQQVEKLETNMEQHFDEVKNMTVNGTCGKKSDDIYEKVKDIKEMGENLEEKVDNLAGNITENKEISDKITDQVKTLENKMESLAQTVNNNHRDQTELSQTIMRTLANLTGLLEKQSEEKAPCATNTPATTTTPAAPTTTTPVVEGVLITGGRGADTSTELYLPGTGKSCSLQSLPDNRDQHSLDTVSGEIILCGGGSSRTSCLQFLTTSRTGSWADYTTLAEARYGHTSHSFQGQLMLTSGALSRRTTEIAGQGATYDLNQDTYYACSIPDQSSYILTGGRDGSGYLNSVVKYNFQGYVANLPDQPDLATARAYHGCGYYLDNGNNKVMIVAGGHDGAGWISSTEILSAGASAWSSGESLPRILAYPASVNIDNHVLLIGGYNPNSGYQGEILKFAGTWTQVGMLETARYGAAATKIEIPANGTLDISACN